jgi:hypothetical protein
VRIRIILPFSLILATAIFRPANTAGAAIPIPSLDRTDAEWQRDFAQRQASETPFGVISVDEFKRITAYYRDLVTDGVAEHAFQTRDGGSIRCVSIATQRSFLQSAPAGAAPLLAPVVPPSGVSGRSGSPVPGFGLDGSPDEEGNARSCPLLTFPQLVPRLDDLYRFRTLDAIFAKHPGGDRPELPPRPRLAGETEGSEPPATAPTGHEYAHAYQYVNNIGTSASFNLWSPAVQRNDEFSLAQFWVSHGSYDDDSLQTVEAGWQVFPGLYGDSKARLFIYTTSRAYAQGSGCYNLMCSRFVQTNSSVVIAGSFTTYSTVGGPQYELPLTVYRDPGTNDWWLRFADTWVGYYPSSLFDAAGLLSFAQKVDCGGEIVNDNVNGAHTTTDMGSGHFAEEGYKHAAYIRDVTFWSPADTAFYPTALSLNATNPNDYDVQVGYSDPNWHTYLLFGGPGGGAVATPLPNLAPYVPEGWSAPIVLSKTAGSTAESDPISSNDALFLNWAIQNNGTAATNGSFSIDLFLDGVTRGDWSVIQHDPLEPGFYLYAADIPIGTLAPGTHEIRLAADPLHSITETNDGDNDFRLTIDVQSAAPPCDPRVNSRCGVRIIVPEPRPPRG